MCLFQYGDNDICSRVMASVQLWKQIDANCEQYTAMFY